MSPIEFASVVVTALAALGVLLAVAWVRVNALDDQLEQAKSDLRKLRTRTEDDLGSLCGKIDFAEKVGGPSLLDRMRVAEMRLNDTADSVDSYDNLIRDLGGRVDAVEARLFAVRAVLGNDRSREAASYVGGDLKK